jgi:hypothetical protein
MSIFAFLLNPIRHVQLKELSPQLGSGARVFERALVPAMPNPKKK